MLETILSAAGGGLFGLIGSGFKLWGQYKEKKLVFQHEVDMAKETRQNMAMEMDLAKIQGTIDLELQESAQDATNLQAAINAEASITGTSPWVDNLRGSLRPFLTYGLCILTFGLVAVQPNNPWINEFVFLSTTAVTFWFGTRPMKSK